MNEPKAFPRLCSLLQREPLPRQSVMRVIVWSISNLLNDERIQHEFCRHKDWINAFLDISLKVPKTSEIRLQAFRGTLLFYRIAIINSNKFILEIKKKEAAFRSNFLKFMKGLWNLGGRNAKKKSIENIHILHDLNAMRTLGYINFDNEKQNLTLCIYAVGFATEIIRQVIIIKFNF